MFDAQQQRILSRQKMAQALLSQGMQPTAPTQAGGFVLPNYGGALANTLQAIVGMQMDEKANTELEGLDKQRRQKTADLLSRGFSALKSGDSEGAAQILAEDESTAPYAQDILKGQMARLLAGDKADVKAPTTRTVRMGNEDVTQEWNPQAGWTEVGRGRAWNPNSNGSSSNPYFTSQPVMYGKDGTPYGVSFDARNNKWSVTPLGTDGAAQPNVPGSGGAPFLPASLDPTIKGDVERAGAAGRVEGESSAKRDFNMQGVTSVIDEADSILSGTGKEKPTESYFGTALDNAASLIGQTPDGAKESDRLKVLGSSLVSKMPRMEGPQSNYDVELYREMAGNVADSTLPIARRRAALATLRGLISKYDKVASDQMVNKPAPTNQRFKIEVVD